MGKVAGIDSSTAGTTVVVCDTDTGEVLRQGYAPHEVPDGEKPTEIDPQAWLLSLGEAAKGGVLEGVQAIGISGQQHGLLALDAGGVTVRPALLRGDKRAQVQAADLAQELGGTAGWADAVGAQPQAAYPVAKLRWLAQHEPAAAKRIAEVMLPHDWLVWQLLGQPARRTTDRGDASGTGYWSAASGEYRRDLVELALGHQVGLPEVLAPAEPAGQTPEGLLISAGTGDNMAAALGLGLGPGDAVVSLGAAGTVFAVHHEALKDPTGTVTAFADATGRHLPVVQVRNAVRTLRGTAELLGTDLAGLSELALQSTPGAYGLVLLPYLEGERTPDLPHTAGTLAGLRRESMKREHLARAAFEGMLCGLADALDVLRNKGVEVRRVFLLGAAAELPAVQALAPALFGTLVVVPPAAEYAAIGAARQAAWSLGAVLGSQSQSEPPHWPMPGAVLLDPADGEPAEGAGHGGHGSPEGRSSGGGGAAVGSAVRQQYIAVREHTHPGAFASL
ncbi:FGGY family carbohydrate kinase [Actinacidiphila bryophytorum]|uniref:Xylulose kinase n=1 Tax=Actinacidiphila bryophytorum TaxID=1436133 RepID=A0A9W4EDF7_9ACTN|nr:FGGY family carbohydrate kinase [Actinacidiphila bryophytorum]MBM9434668.1 sugar kinase [Actinacidiphila bryophytorum]MBN6545626.1 sugar kinase [Actinacidiphila bryophytorum]CAG7628675.1 Xylulose kinase [Actinacidiphila bryophytorum]